MAAGCHDRPRSDEDEGERPDELREGTLQDGPGHAFTVKTAPDEPLRGMARGAFPAEDENRRTNLRKRKAAMTAVVLKRKLRNFPTGNLSQRLATA